MSKQIIEEIDLLLFQSINKINEKNYKNNINILKNKIEKSYDNFLSFFIKKLKIFEFENGFDDKYMEIDSILSYTILVLQIPEINKSSSLNMWDIEFHTQISLFNYLFTSLDKITELFYFSWVIEAQIFKKNNLIDIKENLSFFKNFFFLLRKRYIDQEEELKLLAKKINRSLLILHIKKIRNHLTHVPISPFDSYEFFVLIKILLLFICRILYQLRIVLK